MVKRGWDAHVRGVVGEGDITAEYAGYFKSATEAVECARRVFPKKLDQYNPPFVVVGDDGKPVGKMVDGDGVVNWNFRGDRAIQISKAFDQDDATFKAFDRVERPKVIYAGLMEYDTEWHVPRRFLVPPPSIAHISSKYLIDAGVHCYALAETHKFGHMTFFWNGNRSGYINKDLELYEEVPSLPNEDTETHPEMKAREVTDKLLAALSSGKHKFLRVNYANPDMVGHTGNIKSCIETLHIMDKILAEVIPAIDAAGGYAMILADHGNIEQMIDKTGAVMTSHTTNPVNFVIVDHAYKGNYVVDTTGLAQPGLTNVTATFINLLGFKEPSMYAKGLVKFI
jgi:2,3-bisphosphoglycerate-independent phosphoglycerate mutase